VLRSVEAGYTRDLSTAKRTRREESRVTTNEQDYMPALMARIQQGTPDAMELLQRAAEEHTRDPRPLLLLAGQLMRAGQTDRAEAAYMFALQREPAFAIARFQLGLLQLTSGRPAAAMATWAQLEALPEGEPLRTFKQGLEAMAQDRFEDAQRLLLAGIAANTTNEPLNRDMRMVIERMQQMGFLKSGADGQGGPAREEQGKGHVLVSKYGRAE
jgi:tetratricopeptide (TPR) repeat protein